MRRNDIRNIVIIAHVDHGKTTLVDCLLRQSGQFRDAQLQGERILDSNDLERERGITILAKNIALPYKGTKINIIDTPGHADFGGEVERVVRMADGALVLVDAAEGPMPQTRFVLAKALECGVVPIVVVNKIDRPDARSMEVIDEAHELIVELGGDKHLEHFPHLFASSKEGFATDDPNVTTNNMEQLLDMVLAEVPGPEVEEKEPLQMLVTTLDWSEYVGRIAIGRIQSGSISTGEKIALMKDGREEEGKVSTVYTFDKLGRVEVPTATAGDVAALVGLENAEIGDTICHVEHRRAMPRLTVDEPTLEMLFTINSSPLAGKVGKYVTTRQLRERLNKELEKNVALRVRPAPGSGEQFLVAGRGVLHLSVLIETMRREGYELSVGKPQVIVKKIDGIDQEPFETLNVETPSDKVGPVMELVGNRRGDLIEMNARGDFTYCEFSIPARGLIGLRTKLLNATQGEAVIHHRFRCYAPVQGDAISRPNGVAISNGSGKSVPFALYNLQDRTEFFVGPGDDIYEGMIVGENCRAGDVVVNPLKEKKLTNMRASGSDENVILKPPRRLSLEMALEYIEDDELVEITPTEIRLRKVLLKEADRRREGRKTKAPVAVG